MKFDYKRSLILFFLLLFLSLVTVSASDNSTDVILDDNSDFDDISHISVENENAETLSGDLSYDNVSSEIQDVGLEDNSSSVKKTKITTKINANNPSFYYTKNGQLIGYLKDNDNQPVKNKKVSIILNGKTFTRLTDKSGKVVLKLNLIPNKYNVKIKFLGDSNYSSSQYNTFINVKRLPLDLNANNYNTYWKSDLFYKVKLLDKTTKKPIKGVKVLFRVFSGNSHYLDYYSTTDKSGIAFLKKNLEVGSYVVHTYISNKKLYSISNADNGIVLKIKPTEEFGCCSFYAQLNNDESVSGFRRDSTYSVNLYIQSVKWYGRTAVKQYKTIGSYSFHSIVTSDGWCMGTGGADDAQINRAIENIAGQMVQSNSMPSSKIGVIKGYLNRLGIGHFAIKSPHGSYLVIWKDGHQYGKINPGEYISVPNFKSYFRHGKFASFGSNPAQIGVKIGATDGYGVNRRDITVYHWKAITTEGSTETHIAVHAANDNGKLVGRSTAYLKDNIYFNGKFFSKDSLPQSTNTKYLGYFNMGKIDYLKVKTTVSAPIVKIYKNRFKEFKVTVLQQSNKKPLSGIVLKLKLYNKGVIKTYTLKTDSNGVVKYSFKFYDIGYRKMYIYSANRQYYVSKISGFQVI